MLPRRSTFMPSAAAPAVTSEAPCRGSSRRGLAQRPHARGMGPKTNRAIKSDHEIVGRDVAFPLIPIRQRGPRAVLLDGEHGAVAAVGHDGPALPGTAPVILGTARRTSSR